MASKTKGKPAAAKSLTVFIYRPILHCPQCNVGMEYVDPADADPMVAVCRACDVAVQLPRPTVTVKSVKYPIDGP